MKTYYNTTNSYFKKLSYLKTLVTSFFSHYNVLVGKVQIKYTSQKMLLLIPHYIAKGTDILLTEDKVNALSSFLAKNFDSIKSESSKTLEVRLIRLQYPYLDSVILAQYIALNAGKYNFDRMQKNLLNKVPLLKSSDNTSNTEVKSNSESIAVIAGIKLELAGRLTTQKSIPRKTVENSSTGTFTVSDNTKSNMDIGQYASKNKLGAFTLKVWVSSTIK